MPDGDFIKNDLQLLRHELYELEFEKITKTDYVTCHKATQQTQFKWLVTKYKD